MQFDEDEINTFCFTNGRYLFPNDFHEDLDVGRLAYHEEKIS